MKHQPRSIDLMPTVALQGLCGLQLQEAIRLTWDRVDLVNGTVTIEEDRRSDPRTAGIKNSSRVRKLPIPSLVLEILQEAYGRQGKPSGDQRFINVPSWKAYCSRLTHIFKAWNPECHLPPSDLRNTLATEFNNKGWMTVWFRRYFGHAPANQMERAYLGEQNGLGVKEGTDEFVERLKVEVVDWVESLIQVRSDEIAPCISMIDIASETSIQGTL
jgi:integrase